MGSGCRAVVVVGLSLTLLAGCSGATHRGSPDQVGTAMETSGSPSTASTPGTSSQSSLTSLAPPSGSTTASWPSRTDDPVIVPTQLDTGPPTDPSTPPVPARAVTLGDIRLANDAVADRLLHGLADNLRTGDRTHFLRPFPAALIPRLLSWFDNTRTLGVSGAGFVRTPGYFAPRRDSPTAFTRTVILGVRTPYDDADSLPGIAYTVTLAKGTGGWQFTAWAPSYVQDPMFCGCRLQVARRGDSAVVSSAASDLAGWPKIVLDRAQEAAGWAAARLGGSGLRASEGHVFFLANGPYRWFLSSTSEPEESNATISLVETNGTEPGQLFSTQSRVVLMLTDGTGRIAPQSPVGKLYVWDVIAHESTHQLMNENSNLYYGAGDPIATWVVEGVAVAVEVLHRRGHPETRDDGYYLRDDPRNVDQHWLRDHLFTDLPTRAQLYTAPDTERNNWYALAGSVFLFLADQYGFAAMMKVAGTVYAENNRNPFDYVPDAAGTGYLPRAAAIDAWRTWFNGNYLL